MWKIVTLLQKNLVWSIPIAMLIGLAFGYLLDARPLKQFIIPVTFMMVYPMMVTLNVKNIFQGSDSGLQITTQLINFILIPVLAFFIGNLFFSGGAEKFGLWAVGLFLIGVLPTSGMTISWTGFARGNKEAAMKMVVFGPLIGALAAPVYTRAFMGATVEVDMLHMFRQIALFVFVPLIAGLATQHLFRTHYGETEWLQRIKPKFPPISALGVVLIAFLAMALKAKNIIANPADVILILVPLACFYLVSYGVLTLVGRIFFQREDGIAMVFGVVMRNLSIALAIAMTAFGQQGYTIALLIAMAFVIQIQSAAWYARFVDRIFGRAAAEMPPLANAKTARTPAAIETLPRPYPAETGTMVPDIRKILYATDLSDTARHAVRYACSIGNRFGAEVTVLHVIPDVVDELATQAGMDLAGHMSTEEREHFNRQAMEDARQIMERRISETSRQVLKEIPRCPINAAHTRVTFGNPVNEILREVEEGGYDLVIMGTHGHGKFEETLVGSVARDVIRACGAPVMVVRLPKDETGAERMTAISSAEAQKADRKIVPIDQRKGKNRESS